MRKFEGDYPDTNNTEHSGMADFFFSQWIGWILMEYSTRPEGDRRPTFCAWNGVDISTLFLIDYEHRAFTPIVGQVGGLYLDDDNVIRYDDLFKKEQAWVAMLR